MKRGKGGIGECEFIMRNKGEEEVEEEEGGRESVLVVVSVFYLV